MTDEIREELNNKLADFGKFCTRNKLPLFVVYAEETNGGTEYGHFVLTPYELGIKLSDDRITKYSASLNNNFIIRLKNNLVPEDCLGDIIDDMVGDFSEDN